MELTTTTVEPTTTTSIDDCIDNDNDGYGLGDGCLGDDCNDNNSAVYPGSIEICNGVDENCDEQIDENCQTTTSSSTTSIPECIDIDGDGYGDGPGCLADDCDDANPDINDGCRICEIQIFPHILNKTISLLKPFTGFYFWGLEGETFSRYTEVAWETNALATVYKLPLGKKNRIMFIMVLLKPHLLEIRKEYKVHVGGCVGKITVR